MARLELYHQRPPGLAPVGKAVALQYLRDKFRRHRHPIDQRPHQIARLRAGVVVSGVDLVLPEQQKRQPLGQVRVFAHLLRVACDADDRHGVPVVAYGHVDAPAHIPIRSVRLDGHDLPKPRRLAAPVVIAAHAGGIGAGGYAALNVYEVDVVVANRLKRVDDLLRELPLYRCRHGHRLRCLS